MFNHYGKVNEGLMYVTMWTGTENSPSDISHIEIPLRWEPSVLLKSIKVTKIKESPGRGCRRRKLDPNGEFQTIVQVVTAEVGLWSGFKCGNHHDFLP